VPVYRRLGQGKHALTQVVIKALSDNGYQVVHSDYYSPLPTVSRLQATRHRWCKPSAMRGIDYDLDRMKATLAGLLTQYYAEFARLPPYSEIAQLGFGPGYTPVDALLLYMMIRHRKPLRYVEIGSGVSTYYCWAAGRANCREGYPLRIKCIEPNPYQALSQIPDIECCQQEVQDVDLGVFADLGKNDVLFIDSSHVLKLDGDVPFLYLEVLPGLSSGVLVQVHDVPFPYNTPYPPDLWVLGNHRPYFWNEAMVMQAFLCFNDRFEIVMSIPLIRYSDESFLMSAIPDYKTVDEEPNTFSSIWLERR